MRFPIPYENRLILFIFEYWVFNATLSDLRQRRITSTSGLCFVLFARLSVWVQVDLILAVFT